MDPANVTIRTFQSEIAAHIAQGRLAAYGIDALLVDKGYYDGRVRRVHFDMQVPQPDATRADEILSQPEDTTLFEADPESATMDGPQCPRCAERYAYVDRPAWFWPLALLTLGLPWLFVKPRWHCRRCDHWWDAAIVQSAGVTPYRDASHRH